MERIVGFAVRYYVRQDYNREYPLTLSGSSLEEIYKKLDDRMTEYDKSKCIEGYMTSRGRFVDLKEALAIKEAYDSERI